MNKEPNFNASASMLSMNDSMDLGGLNSSYIQAGAPRGEYTREINSVLQNEKDPQVFTKKKEDEKQDPLNLPREYAYVNLHEKPPSHSNVEGFKVNWNNVENYRVIQKVGRGKYSEVFNGLHASNN